MQMKQLKKTKNRNSIFSFSDHFEKKIGYVFNDKALLEHAMTHSSYANEKHLGKTDNNERLEFLGDAVLELVSSEFLYNEHKDEPEGVLTKLRASMVCETALAYCARELGIGGCLLLGKGEDMSGGRERDSVTSDALEALIGAIYIDGGMESASEFIYAHILSDMEKKQLFIDSKTILQELVQADGDKELSYELTDETGPDHDKKFYITVMIDGVPAGTGRGHTKKAAEQKAAYEAILKYREQK